MPIISSIPTEEVARRTMTWFILLDTTSRIARHKIAIINQAIQDAKVSSEEQADIYIRLAILEYSDKARWMCNSQFLDAYNMDWNNLEGNCLGAACRALDSVLSSNAFSSQQAYPPVVVLFLGGRPVDDYKLYLGKLKDNVWFQTSTKIAFNFGTKMEEHLLNEFVGNVEAIFSIKELYMLKSLLNSCLNHYNMS